MTDVNDWPRCYELTLDLEGGRDLSGLLVYSVVDGDPTVAGLDMLTSGIVGLDVDHDGKLDFDLNHDGHVDAKDMALLRAQPDQHREFFRQRYWIPSGAVSMPWPWCALAYDAAVHHGVGAGVRLVQLAVGAAADGVPGTNTLAFVRAAGGHRSVQYLTERASLFRRINDKRLEDGKPEYWVGWINRLGKLMHEAWAPEAA